MSEQELKDAISDMQECLVIIGKANMKLNNILTQRKADMQKKLDDAYQKGLEEGKKAFDLLDAERDAEYERGLNDAWDAARKINMEVDDGGLSVPDLGKIFAISGNCAIMRTFTAKEAIDRIKAYEAEKDEIHVGDEVKGNSSPWVVTRIYEDLLKGIDAVGDVRASRMESIHKTGRHFDIEPILKEIGR